MHKCFVWCNGRHSSRKHCHLLCVLSHKGKWGTVIFTNILLQLWGVISGPLQGLSSIRHKSLKLFPIYDTSLFPLISGLTFFNLQYLHHSEIPSSRLPVCPARVQLSSLSHRLPWTPEPALESHFPKAAQLQDAASLLFWIPRFPKNWNTSSAWAQRRKDLDTAAKIRENCSKKALFVHAQNIPMGSFCQWQRHVTFLMRRMTLPFTHPWSYHSCGFIFYPD